MINFVKLITSMSGTTDKEEIGILFKNISDALMKMTPKELSEAVVMVINKKGAKTKEVNFIIDSVCEDYSISKRRLFYSRERGEVTEARNIAYCLLHDCLGLTQRYIAKKIFNKNSFIVNKAIQYFRRLNMDVKVDRCFSDRYNRIYIKYANYINNNLK